MSGKAVESRYCPATVSDREYGRTATVKNGKAGLAVKAG